MMHMVKKSGFLYTLLIFQERDQPGDLPCSTANRSRSIIAPVLGKQSVHIVTHAIAEVMAGAAHSIQPVP